MNGFPEEDDMGLAKEHKLQQEIDQQNHKSAIRIAIAEACGWTREYADVPTWNASLNSYQGGYEPVKTLLFRKEEKCFVVENLPDYLSDLNAMHEAEKVLWEMDWSFRSIFNDHLANIIKKRKVNRNEWDAETLLDATAAQRAEAFVKTLSK
jgi:hypothetical protein